MKRVMLHVLGQALLFGKELSLAISPYPDCFSVWLGQLHLNQIKSFDFSLCVLADQAL